MARHYIGATTLTDGKATFPYLCKGSGELQIKASVREGSETIKEDKGTNSNHTDLFNSMTWFTRNTNDTTVNYTNTGSATGVILNNRIPINSKVIIELTLTECTKAYLRVNRYGTNTSSDYHANAFTSKGNVRIEVLNDKTVFYLDNEEVYRANANSSEEFNFEIRCASNDTINFKYANLIIYTLGTGEETISTPTPIMDCKFYDNNDPNNWQSTNTTYGTVTSTTNGLKFTGLTSTLGTIYPKLPTATTVIAYNFVNSEEFILEFELISNNGTNNRIQFYNGSSTSSGVYYAGYMHNYGTGKVKLIYQNNTIKEYHNGTLIQTTNFNPNANFRVVFQTHSGDFTIKDFKIYPI